MNVVFVRLLELATTSGAVSLPEGSGDGDGRRARLVGIASNAHLDLEAHEQRLVLAGALRNLWDLASSFFFCFSSREV